MESDIQERDVHGQVLDASRSLGITEKDAPHDRGKSLGITEKGHRNDKWTRAGG